MSWNHLKRWSPRTGRMEYAVCFDPGTIAIASLAMGAVGTGVSVVGQMQQGQQQAAQSAYLSQVAQRNQMLANQSADQATEEGEVKTQDQQLKTAQIEGSQRAALAGQGSDIDSGSPLDIVGDTAMAGWTDAATTRSNAAWTAYGYKVQGAGYGSQASMYSTASSNATADLPFGIGSSLLGGASSLGTKYAQYLKNNPGGSVVTGDGTGGLS